MATTIVAIVVVIFISTIVCGYTMIKSTELILESGNPVVDIYLKRGDQFIGRDIPRNPFEVSNHITFWADDKSLMVISLDSVKSIHFYDATPINTSK